MTWTRQSVFRRARAADIPAIMAIERQPGYERLVGRWSEAEHRRNISTPGYLYLVHDDETGTPIAFAALSGLGGGTGDVVLNRMIVATPGLGIGGRLLDAILAAVFDGSPAERMVLRVLPDNERAVRLYRSRGFAPERLMVGSGRTPEGRLVDLLMMATTRDSWESRSPDVSG